MERKQPSDIRKALLNKGVWVCNGEGKNEAKKSAGLPVFISGFVPSRSIIAQYNMYIGLFRLCELGQGCQIPETRLRLLELQVGGTNPPRIEFQPITEICEQNQKYFYDFFNPSPGPPSSAYFFYVLLLLPSGS